MATNWSDYCISAVRLNRARTHIDAVKVHPDLGEKLGSGEVWTRQQVVLAIEQSYTFATVWKSTEGNWRFGAAVNIVRVGSEKFLRTDRDQLKADNLDNLPELPAEPPAARY